jgi:hypothetical protein
MPACHFELIRHTNPQSDETAGPLGRDFSSIRSVARTMGDTTPRDSTSDVSSPIEPMAGAPHPKASSAKESEAPPAFQIPSELQDLEREPYHLDRYPSDFRLNDAAESFEALLRTVEEGSREEFLVGFLLGGGGGKGNPKEGAGGLLIDEEDSDSERGGADDSRTSDDDDDNDDEDGEARGDLADSSLSFIPRERFQALYTLVRYVHQPGRSTDCYGTKPFLFDVGRPRLTKLTTSSSLSLPRRPFGAFLFPLGLLCIINLQQVHPPRAGRQKGAAGGPRRCRRRALPRPSR